MAGSLTGGVYEATSIFFWRRTAAGIAVGQLDPNNLVSNTTSHALKATGFVSAANPDVSRGLYINRGDQKILGQADTGVTGYGTFDVTLSTDNSTLRAMVGDSLVDNTTLSNAQISGENYGNPNIPQLGMMYTTAYQSQDPGALSVKRYRTVVFPNVTAVYKSPGGSQSDGENPNPVTLTITPTVGNAFPGGNAFSSAQGWASNQSIMYSIVADNPFALTAFVQDGIATTYTLAYLPATNETGATDHIFTVNGVVTAPTSVDTGTGVVTLTAAGTSGQVAVAFYQLPAVLLL